MDVITSTGNASVKEARKLARRAGRASGDAFLVEGPQAAREALGCLRRLFITPQAATREPELVAAARRGGCEVVQVTERVLDSLADTVTPQGMVGVARLPAPDLRAALDGASLAVVLWQVRDPGNAGAIVRTADAGGADAVVLTRDSVDVRNPKAVRASAGSLFHLPVVADIGEEEVIAACRERGLQLVAADARGRVDHTDVDLVRPTALVFGNEAHGLSAAALGACDIIARVPLQGRAESLNLAAAVAIIVFEAARQRRLAATVEAP